MLILERLGSGEGMPIEAIRAATADHATVAPLLIDAIDRYEPESEAEENGLFIAFHLLGQWREKPAYRSLARFLRRPDVESIMGDATTETSHKIMANVFDGDPAPIYDIINDFDADEFVRSRMFDTLVMLVFQGELDRTDVAAFLRSAFTDLEPRDQCAVWDGWQGAVALLALAELEPLVREAFRLGFVDETTLRFKDFEDDLKQACAGRPVRPWRRKEYEPFGDVVGELSHWAAFQPKKPRTAEEWRPGPWPEMPAKNPFRNVGRNNPCPCGSGKKFKKCCLGKPAAELQAAAASSDPFDADEFGTFDAAAGSIENYDPFVGPNPDDWLATDEQDRLDTIVHYHRREGLNPDVIEAHAAIHAIVENQIAEGDRLPVRRALLRLVAEGLDRHDAIHAIGYILAGHINEQLREARAERQPQSDRDTNAAYYSALEQLSAKGWRRSG
jgi:Protein of unknown function (DUF1186)/SEC-C motif